MPSEVHEHVAFVVIGVGVIFTTGVGVEVAAGVGVGVGVAGATQLPLRLSHTPEAQPHVPHLSTKLPA